MRRGGRLDYGPVHIGAMPIVDWFTPAGEGRQVTKEAFIEYTTVTGKRVKVPAAFQHWKGMAGPPGTGPEGETCGTCANTVYVQYAKRYYKCKLVNYTSGPATDIRLKNAACRHWEPRDDAK